MSIALYDFQERLVSACYQAWATPGVRNVLAVSPTGSGKTVIFSYILRAFEGASCAVAHRRELVSQISLALGKNGVRHGIGAPDSTRRTIIQLHIEKFGRHYVDDNARCRVVGIDTLLTMDEKDPWLRKVGLWVVDEGHHVLRENKWGRGVARFPESAFGLLVTATPIRADGKGLGRHAAGVADRMVLGPGPRELINRGYLSDYQIFCPPSDIRLDDLPIGDSGDYSQKPLRARVNESKRIVGDVVGAYRRFTPGQLGITFAVDVLAAQRLAQGYQAQGIPAEVVTSETPDLLRSSILRRFAARKLLQLVNVDLFGEGFDVPACSVVSMARPTMSYALYAQQFGRPLRVDPEQPGKLGTIIDHVGNVQRHKVPDRPRVWSLDNVPRMSRAVSDGIPLRVCLHCFKPYERIQRACPYCQTEPEIALRGRTGPKEVDGDLQLVSPEVLAQLRGEVDRVRGALVMPAGLSFAAQAGLQARHRERQNAQMHLQYAMAVWGGHRTLAGDSDPVLQRRFFHVFGVDVMTAQTLGAPEAKALTQRIEEATREHHS